MLKSAGEKLQFLRKKNLLTQEELASILKVSKNYLSAVECGKRTNSLTLYKSAVQYFKVSFDYFFSDESDYTTNIYIDLVLLKMRYMDSSLQKLVLKIVDNIFDYQETSKK